MKIDVPQILMKILYLLSSRCNIMIATQREQKYQINVTILLYINRKYYLPYIDAYFV